MIPAGSRFRNVRLVSVGSALAFMVIAGVGGPVAPAHAVDANAQPAAPQIVKRDYRGWHNSYRLSNGIIEAHVVTDIGPRIMDLRTATGANLLYVREAEAGKRGEDKWVQRGGWRLWIAPERTETTYELDNTPCTAEIVAGVTLRVTGPPQPSAGIQKQVDVSIPAGEPHLHLTARIKNISEHPLTYAAWSLPVLRPGGRAFVPLDVGPATAFDAVRRLMLWSYTEIGDPRYRFDDRLIQIDHTRVPLPPVGQSGRHDDESKIGVDSGQGWAAYLLNDTLLVKRFPHQANGQYPDGGATIEVYSSHEFLELENLSPLTTIAPGEEIVLPEDWWVFTGVTVPLAQDDALQVLEKFLKRE